MRKEKKPLNKDQVHRISKELAVAESQAAVQDLELFGRDAWKLFIIFIATIAMILVDAMPIFVCSLGALAVAILTGVLTPAQGFSGFSEGVIILIVVAFAIARGVVKSGLGKRIVYLVEPEKRFWFLDSGMVSFYCVVRIAGKCFFWDRNLAIRGRHQAQNKPRNQSAQLVPGSVRTTAQSRSSAVRVGKPDRL